MFFLDVTEGCLAMLGVLYFIRELLKIICFLVPIGLIVILSIDIAKGVIASEGGDKKILNLAIKRIIFAMFLFLLPELVFGLFSISFGTIDSSSCWTYINEVSIEDVRELLEAQEETLAKQMVKAEEEQQQYAKDKAEANDIFKQSVAKLSNKSGTATSDGTFIGNTYTLTKKQLQGIAYLCQREQGTAKGAAAEASLMANRFELYANSSYKKNGTGLYNYIKNSGWWAGSKKYMSNPSKVNQKVLDAVKSVLVLGKRTLPLYVDEHDCIYCGSYGYDVVSIVTNGKKITNKSELRDHSNYKKDKTKINNKYGATYTFYSFPTEGSDPFGYTAAAKKKIESKTKK